MQARADRIRCDGETVVFVPTMGFLHPGHTSLMKLGRDRGDHLVVSIFVNPTQFGPNEDLDRYPRALERDLELTESEGVDTVFVPDEKALYPRGFQTHVRLERLPEHLCGLSRPIFFQGVATIVTKLFHIVKPHVAVFGQKDYQQLLVVQRLVEDLNMAIEIVGGPTIREPDGLAMSSRNNYLNPDQREAALSLYRSLKQSKATLSSGVAKAADLIGAARQMIESHPDTEIDYVRICHPKTLEDMDHVEEKALMALAVKVGATRLIDNMILEP
jgi:pantoate--beta-alanine ligase